MTTQHHTRYSSYGRSSRRLGPFLCGFLFAFLVLVADAGLYLRFGHPPVAAADKPFPLEKQIVQIPLEARIDRELQQPPFGASEDAFESGARIYVASCAGCHGTPGHDAPFANRMYPAAPQLFRRHPHSAAVGVSDDQPGETYWKVRNGIRLTGMPAFQHLYSDAQVWDVALLLKNADQPLPDPVQKLLQQP